jgi:glyceraldehyde 3-phosphate dehydrogenase (phosphorylating)
VCARQSCSHFFAAVHNVTIKGLVESIPDALKFQVLNPKGSPKAKEKTHMAVKVGINGFGRIGRNVLRAALGNKDIDFVAVNDLTSPATLAHLLKYDSILGNLPNEIKSGEDFISVDGKKIKVWAERDPAKLPWADVGAQVVIESTGHFTDATKAKAHLGATVKKVIISAPATNEDITLVLGVNEDKYDPAKHNIISNASCTTNCLAPVVKVILETTGLVSGIMTTIHSYTNDQVILDFPHKDLRRARAAALNMIPSSTGAAKALKLVIPETAGKLDGFAIRVPTPNVSIVDLTYIAEKPTTVETLNAAFVAASEGKLKGILGIDSNLLVSSDFKGDKRSSIVDAPLTKVVGQSVKVLSWYDNEWGYSNRVVDLIGFLEKKGL